MKCQICKQNEATISINHSADGATSNLTICEPCAAQKGLNLKMAVPLLTDLLLGLGPTRTSSATVREKECPACRMKLSEFRKTSLLGCPSCYTAFKDEVQTFLEAMQKGSSHIGKVPAAYRVAAEIASLRGSLQDAVRDQKFEEAARLRDRIGDLRAESGVATIRDETPDVVTHARSSGVEGAG